MPVVTNSIFHFTDSISIIENILNEGFKIFYCLEIIDLNGTTYGVGIPMVSYCDIPLTQVYSHVSKYCDTDPLEVYGIGMSKNWATKNGINPVFYIADDSNTATLVEPFLTEVISDDWRHLFEVEKTDEGKVKITDVNKGERRQKRDALFGLISYIKNIKGKRKLDSKKLTHFYEEREWRFVPLESFFYDSQLLYDPILSVEEYKEYRGDPKSKKNAIPDLSLTFNIEDIHYIIVPDLDAVEYLIDLITSGKTRYTDPDEQYQLLTKIIPYTRIDNDF